MVKDSSSSDLVKGLPRKRAFVKRKPVTKDGRIMMRVHQDLEDLVKRRAAEEALPLSRYIERLLIDWLNADPRNPKTTITGERAEDAPSPVDLAARDEQRFRQRWRSFGDAYAIIHGHPPSQSWYDDFIDHALARRDEIYSRPPTPEAPMPMPPAVKAMVERSKTKKR